MTAQDAFKQMVRDTVDPALREMGFKGSAAKAGWYTGGDYGGAFWIQKSVRNNKNHVRFTVHLSAGHGDAVYWARSLLSLVPGNVDDWLAISETQSAGSAGDEVLAAFRGYGWPAMLAAFDNPGFPPDPGAHWARTFPLPPADGPARERREPPWFTRPAGNQHDWLFAGIADEDPKGRFLTLYAVGSTVLDDPRAIPALLDSLEHDPSPDVRRIAASGLRHLASRDDVGNALRLAAAEDEDLQVRWEARYALRLAGLPGATERS
jgi:hypothetical protein